MALKSAFLIGWEAFLPYAFCSVVKGLAVSSLLTFPGYAQLLKLVIFRLKSLFFAFAFALIYMISWIAIFGEAPFLHPGDLNCECGELQDTEHLLECSLCPTKCTIDDLWQGNAPTFRWHNTGHDNFNTLLLGHEKVKTYISRHFCNSCCPEELTDVPIDIYCARHYIFKVPKPDCYVDPSSCLDLHLSPQQLVKYSFHGLNLNDGNADCNMLEYTLSYVCNNLELGEYNMKNVDHKGSRLNHRKDSLQIQECVDVTSSENHILTELTGYPFAVVLRLRVLQIVCGISAVVMGAVAFIEERGRLHLGLGMPAGILTVAAAAVSIHTSRGFSGYTSPSCSPPLSLFRFLGPTVGVAVSLTLLWLSSVLLHIVLFVFCLGSLFATAQNSVMAGVLLLIAVLNLATIALVLRIDCRYDPD